MNIIVLLVALGLAIWGWSHAGFVGALTGFVTLFAMAGGIALIWGHKITGDEAAGTSVSRAHQVGHQASGVIITIGAPAAAVWLGWTWGSLGAVGGYVLGMILGPLFGFFLGNGSKEEAEEQPTALAFVSTLEVETADTWQELVGEVLESPEDMEKHHFRGSNAGRHFYAASAAVRLVQLDSLFERDQASRLREHVMEYLDRQDRNQEDLVDRPTRELVSSYEDILKDATESSLSELDPSDFENAVDVVASVLADEFTPSDRLAVDRQVLVSYLNAFLCKGDSFAFWSDVRKQVQLVPTT